MVLCAELSGTHGGHTGRACYNLISAALLLQSKEQQEAFFKVFSFSLLLKVRKEVPAGPLPGERLAAGLRAADAGGDAAAVGAGPGLAAAVPRLPQRLVPAAGDLHPQHRL